jgi:hypothetical protein
MLFSLLHIGWMILAFYRNSWIGALGVAALHLASSYLTMLNGSSTSGGCAVALSLLGLELVAVSGLAYACVMGLWVWRRLGL